MGNAILYCAGCNTQLRESDFDRGEAFRADARAWCKACAPEEVRSQLPPPTERRRVGQNTSRIMKVAPPPSTRRMDAVPSSSSKPLLISGAVVAGIVLLALAAMMGGGSAPPPATEPPTPPPPVIASTPVPPPPPRNEKPAEEALKRARDYAQVNPENLTAQLALFDTAVREAEGTGHHATAMRERDAVLSRQRAAAKVQLDALDAAVKAACDKEEFAAAAKLIDDQRSRPMGPDWSAELGARSKAVDDSAEKLFAALRKDAAEARKRGAEDEVKRLTERVEKWGIEAYRSDLAKAVAAAIPKPKPKPAPPKEADAYRKKWADAMTSVAARDPAAALPKLEQAGAGLADPAVKAEAAADAECLKAVLAAHDEGLQLLLRTAKGQKLTLAFVNEGGTTVELAGTVARAEGGQLDLTHEKGTTQIPAGEIAARSIAQALKGKREGRDLALLCLTAGDGEGAKTFVEGTSTIPDKYWKFAPAAGAAEAEARRQYYSADRESVSYGKAIDAAQKFAALLKDRGDTAFVKRNRALIAARAEPQREFFFAFEDLRIGGAFKAFKGEKEEPYWKAQADTDPARADTYVDLAFAALADTEYRCWVYVGGCCAESIACSVRIAEGAEPPGEAAPAKQLPSMQYKTHASHEGRGRPTAKWGWVQLPVPKFAAAGVKQARIVSPLKNFSIAQALVSATRPSPPGAAELRDLERIRTEQRGAVKTDPSLVGHWKFNEGSGTTAADSGPFGVVGKLGKGASWTAGNPPALKLDGTGGVILGSDLTMLQRVTAVTLAAWICPDKVGGETQHSVILGLSRNNGATPTSESRAAMSVGYGGSLSGGARATDTGKAQTMKTVEKPIKVGSWVHIAVAIDYAADTVTLFVNGAPLTGTGSVKFEAKITPNTPSTNGAIGVDDDGKNGCFTGKISDVRLYNRALSKDEIAEIAASR